MNIYEHSSWTAVSLGWWLLSKWYLTCVLMIWTVDYCYCNITNNNINKSASLGSTHRSSNTLRLIKLEQYYTWPLCAHMLSSLFIMDGPGACFLCERSNITFKHSNWPIWTQQYNQMYTYNHWTSRSQHQQQLKQTKLSGWNVLISSFHLKLWEKFVNMKLDMLSAFRDVAIVVHVYH